MSNSAISRETGKATLVALSAPTWEDLPDAIKSMQVAVASHEFDMAEFIERTKDAAEVNVIEIYIGGECVLKVPIKKADAGATPSWNVRGLSADSPNVFEGTVDFGT